MSEDRLPILIVGAGPTGLTLALELARAGIRFRIIDKAPQRPDVESRAIVLHQRSLEVFARNGVVESFLQEGNPLTATNLYSSGKKILKVNMAGGNYRPYPYSLILEQGKSERILIARLTELGIEIERPVSLETITTHEDHVYVTMLHEDGRLEEASFDYLVGCDGAHSVVRHALDIGFIGSAIEGKVLTGDVMIEFPSPSPWANHEVHTLLRPGHMGFLLRLKDGYWRFAVGANHHNHLSAENVSLDDIREEFSTFPEFKGVMHDCRWKSLYKISTRIAASMKSGLVFLAGDAVHIHSPEGGHGMNAGIQDAVNLAWKLTSVIKGGTHHDLLESYQAERLPIIRDIIKGTERSQKVITLVHPRSVATRDILLPILGSLGPFQKWLHRIRTATSHNYRHSKIILESVSVTKRLSSMLHLLFRGSGRTHPHSGDWAPEASDLIHPDGSKTSLHALLQNDLRCLVLMTPGGSQRENDLQKLTALRDQLLRDYPTLLDPKLISLFPARESLHDSKGEFHKIYGASGESIFLIRPDGFLGYIGKPICISDLETYLTDRLLARRLN